MLTRLIFVGDDDAALVEALRAGHPDAVAVFHDRYSTQVRAMLVATIGPDDEIPDLLQEVLIRALDRIRTLREVDKLASWLATITVYVARAHIRMRSRRRWLGLFSPQRTRAWHVEQPSSEARDAVREVYAILDQMPVEQRMAFVLRNVHDMSMPSAAEACETSLSTFKRRLKRAETHFLEVARTRPSLVQWLEDGTRWNQQTRT
jgi:RNA polymerase sigma-70 factor (ECF subfamily)